MTSQYKILMNKMEVNASIDTTCAKIVSGKNWFHNFLKCLDDTALYKVKIVPIKKKIQLGDGRKVFSTFQVIIPARIESTD